MIIAHLVWALLILFLYRSHAFVFFLLKKKKKQNRLKCYFRCWEHRQFPMVRAETLSKCQQIFIIISIPYKVQLLKILRLSKKNLEVGQKSHWVICTKQYPSDCYYSFICTIYSPYIQSTWADCIDSMAPQVEGNGHLTVKRKEKIRALRIK